ncbi:MAG: YfiR family protein [Nitrospinota bacterium]|nr:YfiR family protein [Nitrospinota bacterium]
MKRKNGEIHVIAAVISLLLCSSAFSSEKVFTEYQVKSVFIYNFAKFVDWPEQAFSSEASPVNVCVLGEDPFGNEMDLLTKKSARGRGFDVLRFSKFKDKEELKSCHLLFISKSEESRIGSIIESLSGFGVLTISDVEGFMDSGGIIEFTMRENKVRFAVNLKASEQAGIRISAKLLKLAEAVKK